MEVVSSDNWSYKTCKAPVKSSPSTNQASFLQAGCPFCRQTNSVKALKEKEESLSLSLHFNGHFPGEPGLAGAY